MESLEIKGKVVKVLPTREGTSANGNAWKQQTIIVEYQDGQYTSKIALGNMKKADEFGKLNVGDEGTFKCNIPTSREYNGNWYTQVNCWGWDIEGKTQPTPAPQQAPQVAPASQEDMPF